MRIEINCKLENKEIALDYNRKILSLFKKALENYKLEIKDYFYGDPKEKDMTFSCYLPIEKIEENKIFLKENKFKITLSLEKTIEAIHFYNALIIGKNLKFDFGNNKAEILDVKSLKEKEINSEIIMFKTLSPILVREKPKDSNKSWYYVLNEEKAMEVLKKNLIYTLKNKFLIKDIEDLEIIPIDIKKVIITYYNFKLPATKGIIVIKGKKEILNYFYKAGFASRKSSGFGMLEII
ncbi:MAG: CRISPR-associated endoribonuclease Cas6 [Fusobacterium ulcerans]|uniref:CRISPR-associated endoribonuclease Cas6 n=1 Tax=Fusobacterium ulcerans TaxID=861 RepID=UPI003A87E866